jgi:hypothetical protein
MIAFTNDDNKVVFIAHNFSSGVVDLIKYSKLKPILIGTFSNIHVEDILEDRPQLDKLVETYKVGDEVFVYHHPDKKFEVSRVTTTINDKVTWSILLTEKNPINPKFPLVLNPQHCNYPKVM